MKGDSVRATRLIAAGLITGLIVGLTACAVGPDYRTPQPDEPPSFAAQAAATTAPLGAQPSAPDVDPATWWRSLNDEELNSLVDRAVKSNLDLEIAVDRLQQARTYETVVIGHALPEVDASAAAGRGTGTDLTRGRAQQGLVSADNTNGLQQINSIAGFDAVWELDLFGKFRREFQAARADTEAARAARYDVLTSVVADVVRAYIDLRGFQMRAGICARPAMSCASPCASSVFDMSAASRTNWTSNSRPANWRHWRRRWRRWMPGFMQRSTRWQCWSANIPRTWFKNSASLTSFRRCPPPPPPGVPIDLLKRRPDIQQAERELAAASARIGAATANLFPQVALIGSIGAQAQGWGTVPAVGKHIWSFGPGATWPLLDFGALDAQVDIAHLAAHASLMNYRRTILNAVEQVDTSLDAYRAQQLRLERLSTAMAAGDRAVDLATRRYNRGLTDFLNVVDAEREFYDLQEQYAITQVAQGEQFVQLYKSLGGAWQNYRSVPAIRLPQPAVVAAFRRVLAP